MSGKLTDAVWRIKLERSEREVLLAMCGHADNNGCSCFPSVALLSWETDLSERQVQRCLKSLREMGVLEAVEHPNGGRGYTVHYNIDLDKAPLKTPYIKGDKGDAQMSPIEAVKGDISVQERVTFPAVKGDIIETKGDISGIKGDAQMSPEPSIEPSSITIIEPSHESRAHAGLRERLAEIAPDYGYRTDEVCADSVWGAYPRAGRKNRPEVLRLVREMNPADWRSLFEAARNYALSSVVERGMVTSLPRWIEGEDWRAYVEGPIVDAPKQEPKSARAEIADLVSQSKAYVNSMNGNGGNGHARYVEPRPNEIRPAGIQPAARLGDGGYGTLLSFPGSEAK